MQLQLAPPARRVDRPRCAWLALAAAVFTGVLAIPVGLLFIADPTGRR